MNLGAKYGFCVKRGMTALICAFLLGVGGDDLLLDIRRHYLIMAKGHRVTAASASNTFELAIVLRNFRQRHLSLDNNKVSRQHILP